MLSFKSFLNVFAHKQPVAPQVIRLYNWLPLPCPRHSASLIPEECGDGSYKFYCPLCRASNQPVEQKSLPDWLPTEQKPVQAISKPAEHHVRAGGVMHADRAIKRTEAKLGKRIMPARPTRQLVPNRQAIYAAAPTVMDIGAALRHE